MNRIAGLETEYGCLTSDPSGPPTAVGRTRNWVFEKNRFGLADMHQRDWDEPAGNGGFLFNGGRVYVDMGHLEYCTPECISLIDILRYDRAGDAILVQALKDMRLTEHVSYIRNNVDHYSGATFGCHENYLVRRAAPLTESNILSLLTFLTARLLYTGAGRVGSSPGAELRGDITRSGPENQFQISQRADYINNDLFEWVQFNRAIINTRDEPLADARRYRRLHLLHGDTSVLPTTLLLKVGTTSLVLDLLELDYLPKLILADAVMTFRSLSHQPDGPWLVPLVDGHCVSAIEVMYQYYERANSEFRGRDPETDVLLRIWKQTMDSLGSDSDSLVGQIDWVTKRWLFRQFVERENVSWGDPWLKSQDIEFHNVDPSRGLGIALAQTPSDWAVSPSEYTEAMRKPPADTRANSRSRIMHLLKEQNLRYFVDWEVIDAEGISSLNLLNPFESNSDEVDRWAKQLATSQNSGT